MTRNPLAYAAAASFGLVFAAGVAYAATIEITQKDRKFSEKRISISKGDSITFTNQDDVSHNIYSKSETLKFDTGVQAPGESNTILFDENGRVKIRCAIHPKMKLTVKVE